MSTLYLRWFSFPTADDEFDYYLYFQERCYNDFYPFGVLSGRGVSELAFSPITMLSGGNGSGKTTALNVMAEKIGAKRDAPFNRSAFWEDYVGRCAAEGRLEEAEHIEVITSDDVFDFMLHLRALNQGIDDHRKVIFEEYRQRKNESFQLRSMEDYAHLKEVVDARRQTRSRYTRERVQPNVAEHSNGESAWLYFTQRIQDGGLYLLDEPENSLSPARQLELADFLLESVRYFNCQFIIATHSPLLLAMDGATIYDLDAEPVRTCRWTELKHVQLWHSFFQQHEAAFHQEE